MKRKPNFENYKNYLEAAQLDDEIKYPEKKLTQIVSKKNHIKFVRNNKSILKTQLIFKSEKHNVFTLY